MPRKTVIAIVSWFVAAAVIAALLWAAWFWWQRLALPGDSQAALAIAAPASALLLAIWWFWWRLPKRQVRGLDISE